MSAQDEIIDQVRATLGLVSEALEALDDDAREASEEHAPGALDRVPIVNAWIEHLLDSVDPDLLSPLAFQPLQNQLAQVHSTLQQLAANPAGFAPNLPGALDGVVLASGAHAIATPPMRLLSDEAARLGEGVGRRLGQLKRTANALSEQLDELGKAAEQRDRQHVEAHEEQLSTLQAKVTALEQTLTVQTDQAETLLTTLRTEFDAAEQARATEHARVLKAQADQIATATSALEDHVSEFKTGLEETVAEHRTAISAGMDDAAQQLEQRAESALTHIDQRREKIESLYEVIFKAGTASAFNKEAETERGAADTWRKVAIGFGVAAIALAAITAFLVNPDDLTTQKLIAKLAATAGLGAIAAYAGRQSARHRRREEDAKQLELDLTAIAPFVEEVDESKRDEVRQLFVERWMSSRATSSKKIEDETVVGVPVTALAIALAEGFRNQK